MFKKLATFGAIASGLFAATAMAVGVVKPLKEAGRADILVAGFDNIPAVSLMIADGRMLATVDQFGQPKAADAIDQALAVVAGGPALEGWIKTDISLVTANCALQK